MNMRLKLAVVLIPLGILVAAIPDNKIVLVKANPEKILSELKESSHLMTSDVIADLLVKKDPSLQLVDVRNQGEYNQFHLPGAVSVPIANLLAGENSGYFDQELKTTVLYANGNTAAVEAWMLLRQSGYKNVYVLQGGLNNWAETIMNPTQPAAGAPDDEQAKYDFRKAAGGVLGGGTLAPTQAAPPVSGAPKAAGGAPKKRAAGGC